MHPKSFVTAVLPVVGTAFLVTLFGFEKLSLWLHIKSWSQAGELTGCIAIVIVSSMYIAGYSLVAISIGHFRIALWPYTVVEVDAGIPNHLCNLVTFQIGTKPQTMRHGIYGEPVVQKFIIDVLYKLATEGFSTGARR